MFFSRKHRDIGQEGEKKHVSLLTILCQNEERWHLGKNMQKMSGNFSKIVV